jgi:hypothetical protein
MVSNAQATTYLKSVNWDGHSATLRTAQNSEHRCFISKQPILTGEKYYSIVTWNAGLAGRKFPAHVKPEFLDDYKRIVD